ncbi:MBL fold metallo-hydrolase [Actinomycetospora cinnamomea]|uniref:Glyoxylase-like metal-dependent hydrolase (Beta-lactamase superfamily II) n=1 Tax=Actinomycetospora cinnamomea TaxID=663609 RepID=A0A2U1FRN1_9PSEU|nr:MBL fold metallo-hydrolase [Actinomycetospora cinnamomea]PVZ14772.1 glyoxylase-like metal-dependent hydrolase (beta-lactamase superfamily II) [Actinomycetospora cinnamomea]
MEPIAVVDEGLGNSSYMLDLGDGRAAVIDPARDPRPYSRHARRRGLGVAYAVETHVHADFVTGTRELAADGAEIVAAAGAELRYPHRGVRDGDRVDLGGLVLEVFATPGHTPAHVAWLLRDGEAPLGVFTGGALGVGGMARTDLAGRERTEELARAAYRSIHDRLLALPDELPVWPTHGAGSFCSTDAGGERASTIGAEKDHNPLLTGDPDEDTFVARLTAGFGSYPAYFDRLPTENQAGPRVLGRPWPALPLPDLDVNAVQDLLARGAQVVDARPIDRFARGHLPGAISDELRGQFGTWLGWVVDPTRPVVLVVDDDQDLDELVRQALTVGVEDLAGRLAGGVETWRAEGLPLQTLPLIDVDAIDRQDVLDIRQDAEWQAGHLPHAAHVELGALATGADVPVSGATAVMCAHGQRSMTAASLIARDRGTDQGLEVVAGSAQDWAEVTGRDLEHGA